MKIILAGDFHGNLFHAEQVFHHAQGKGAEAIVQLGDFGFGWEFTRSGACKFTEQIGEMAAQHGVPLYWIDGNHENFDLLEQTLAGLTPQADGTYRLSADPVGVFYIPRGTVLEWDGQRILCCGGAVSIDKGRRRQGVSWWPQEPIGDSDVEKCFEAGPADILLTHDFPMECNIVDRHLDPYWGEEANANSQANRKRVSKILVGSDARRVFYGHLHISYEERIYPLGHEVTVRGLDCDATTMRSSTFLLDLSSSMR